MTNDKSAESKKISDYELDQLAETISIGAGNASTAISKLTKSQVNVEVPSVKYEKIELLLPQILQNPEEIVTGVLLTMQEDVEGIIMMIYSEKNTLEFAGLLSGQQKKSLQDMEEIDRSALEEMGNIVTGAALSALGNFLDLHTTQSVPESVTDMAGSIFDNVIAETGKQTDRILLFEISVATQKGAESKIYFFFTPEASEKIVTLLNKKFKKQ